MFGKNCVYVAKLTGVVDEKMFKRLKEYLAEVESMSYSDVLLLYIDSPGGSPQYSEEIWKMIWHERYTNNKSIYCYINNICTSGGYYIASACERIYANPNAVVGSVGVIMPKYNIKELADKVGVSEDNITVGSYKRFATMFEPVDDESKKYILDNLMSVVYDVFKDRVVQGRKHLAGDDEWFDGKVFAANKCVGFLVDTISNETDLKHVVFKYFKWKELKEIVEKKSLFDRLFKVSISINAGDSNFKMM